MVYQIAEPLMRVLKAADKLAEKRGQAVTQGYLLYWLSVADDHVIRPLFVRRGAELTPLIDQSGDSRQGSRTVSLGQGIVASEDLRGILHEAEQVARLEHQRGHAADPSQVFIYPEHALMALVTRGNDAIRAWCTEDNITLDSIRRRLSDLDKAGERKRQLGVAYEPLVLLIDPGKATKADFAQLFTDIDALYRAMGGSGVTFSFIEVKDVDLVLA